MSGSIVLLQNLNDWLPSDDKSSSLPYCSLAWISGTQLCAPDSRVYSQVAVRCVDSSNWY